MRRLVLLTWLFIVAGAVAGCDRTPAGKTAGGGSSGVDVPAAAATHLVPSEKLGPIIKAFNRGVALMDRYESAKAIEAFEQVKNLAPGWTTGRLDLGIALLNTPTEANLARAEKELKWVIEADDDNPYAHYALGMLLLFQGRHDEARPQFERTLEIDPQDADAHYQMGVLLAETDPQAARRHLTQTLQRMPHHASACYRLSALLRTAGEADEAQKLLDRFQALKQSGAGVFMGMKYGEMGRYADVVRVAETTVGVAGVSAAPNYHDAAAAAGLTLAGGGGAGWPGAAGLTAEAFGPGVAVGDVDNDGRLDLYITAVSDGGQGAASAGALYRNVDGAFQVVQQSGIDGRGAVGAYFGDYDGDGDADLFVTCAGSNRLYRNDGGMRFTDVTVAAGVAGGQVLSVGAAWADADHDGDLDLYVANYARLAGSDAAAAPARRGAPNALWRNNGDGTFTDVAADAGVDGGDVPTVAVAFIDVDDDRDVDVLVFNDGAANGVFINDRVGRYHDGAAAFTALADDGPALGAAAGDVDGNGLIDLLLIRGPQPPRLLRQVRRGTFAMDPAFDAAVRGLGGASGALVGDLDLDGDVDIVLLDAGAAEHGHRILMNEGGGQFAAPIALGPSSAAPASRGAVAVDLDGDGALELLVTRAGAAPQLWRPAGAPTRRWLDVAPRAGKPGDEKGSDAGAVGMIVEIKTGQRLEVGLVSSSSGYLGSPPPRAHFGLGDAGVCDYVRLSWPDGVFQSELEIAANQHWTVGKVTRKPSSCPVLFTWDGRRFACVTDFLGVGGLGFFMEPGVYAPPDPTEDVRISPEMIQPMDGKYLLRIAEPLEEATYLDELHLIAYDHPASSTIYPDERLATAPPWPTGRPIVVRQRIMPTAARDQNGRDVRPLVMSIDRQYVEPGADRRFVGYAPDHWLELDFGDALSALGADRPVVLCLYGWVEYTYSHVNYAAYQAGLRMAAPVLEVPDGAGGWRAASAEIGYPAGLPRMMTVPLPESARRSGRFRIRTNMQIFWDQVFVAVDEGEQQLKQHTLRPTLAELRPLGFPREFSPDGSEPTLYDYGRLDRGVPFKNLSGAFTRFGDVRPLLGEVDDRFVIMGRGEEIALAFDAGALPPLPDGWTRTLVLHVDGYCKDMDLYTAYPDTLEPLPYHGMDNYPPTQPYPDAAGWDLYRRMWNTRRIADE